jgi:hypothetical protein
MLGVTEESRLSFEKKKQSNLRTKTVRTLNTGEKESSEVAKAENDHLYFKSP